MIRCLYRCLLSLHPPSFRREFADEMLWIFDETARGRGSALFPDVVISLARQWLLRSGSWKVALAILGGFLHVSAGLAAVSSVIPRLAVYPLDGTWTGRAVSRTSSVPMELTLNFEDVKWVGEIQMGSGTRPIRAIKAGLYLAFRADEGDAVMNFWGKPAQDSNGTRLTGIFTASVHDRKLREGTWELIRETSLGNDR